VAADLGDAADARLVAGGVYVPPDATDGLYVASIRALVRTASLSPALARRRVFVVGDAERMVPQEGADAAANAFLKLLEEPPPGAYLILTSSEPTALLPTIRSRVVAVRCAPPTEGEWLELLSQPAVATALEAAGGSVARARGVGERSLGALLSKSAADGGRTPAAAQAIVDAAVLPAGRGVDAAVARAAFVQGSAGARGGFAAVLDEVQRRLREECRAAVTRGDGERAAWFARACGIVEAGKVRTAGNANPSLLAARLLRDLRAVALESA
jgi:DNA polymerase-3 subunit delta'